VRKELETKEIKKRKRPITGLATEICIWKDESECSDCNLHEKIFCRPKLKYLLMFALPMFFGLIPMVIGVIFANLELLFKIIFFGGWIGYSFFFFNVWESRMVCNHCPYYANDEQKSLHCPIDKGKLKTSKYDPGPASKSEKIQFAVGALIFVLYPIPFLIVGNLIPQLILYSLGIIIWIIVIQLKVCSDCINFACLMNRVPESIRNEFIKKNPVIRKAWEEKGYKFN